MAIWLWSREWLGRLARSRAKDEQRDAEQRYLIGDTTLLRYASDAGSHEATIERHHGKCEVP